MDPLKGKDSCVNQVYPKEYLFKVLVIGEFGVGKTSIIRRYTEGYFVPSYKMTIGVDFSMKSIPWNPMTHVNIQLWDIAGHERFGHMTRVYYKYAMAAIVVFDLSRSSTLEAVSKWIEGVRSKVMLTEDDPIPCFLFANKCDIDSIEIDTVEMNNFCQQNNIETWFPTSAKDDINIGHAMNYITEYLMRLHNADVLMAERYTPLENSIMLSNSPSSNSGKCCVRKSSEENT